MIGPSNHPESSSTDQAPGPRSLSRWQLTLTLILVTLLPFSLVVVLYSTLPEFRDPVLAVNVEIGPRAWPSADAPDARMVLCATIRNPTKEAWNNLNMSINEQFHFTHPDPVDPGEEIFVPLKFFHTKGTAYFPPETQELKLLTIYAQIPSGARAIREIEAAELNSTLSQ